MAVRTLGFSAFALLATVMCARALLNEERSLSVSQLLIRPEFMACASPTARHICHLVAAGGIGLTAAWIALSRRSWQLGALEWAALVLTVGALLSVSAASDQRLALNSAIDTILPLIGAAALCQLLAHRAEWRRALMAGLVAIVAANCWKATAQRYWEYEESRRRYEQNKVALWTQQGVRLDDPEVAAFEEAQRAARPMGFIRGANVFSSFLLLGLACTAASAGACGWRVGGSRRNEGVLPSEHRSGGMSAAAFVRILLVFWPLAGLFWTRTAGATLGLLAAMAAGAAGLWLRDRPRRLAILLAGGLALLQIAIVVLALCPADLHRAMLGYRGAAGKVRTLGARLCYWNGAIQLFAAHPLTGTGPSQFGKHYLAIRPVWSDERPPDAHNWLLNMAAEWGILGILGVLIAAGGGGWHVLRAISRPPDRDDRPATAAFLPAVVVVLGSWLLVACDLPRSLWAQVLPYPAAISLAAALVSVCTLRGRTGQVLLLAGLVGFFVHCASEITPSVPGVMWPFWATVALAITWNGRESTDPTDKTPSPSRAALAAPILAGASALAVFVLTIQPMRAVALMSRAQQSVLQNRPQQAMQFLREASEADSLDPLPAKAAAFLRYRWGRSDPEHALAHFRDCVALSETAVQRNPFDYESWRSLGLANMYLATVTEDFGLVKEAIRDVRRALELNPQWPAGWLELARMAAVQSDTQPDQPDLLREALAALDKADALFAAQTYGDVPQFSQRDLAEILRIRKDVQYRLSQIAGPSSRSLAQ